MSKRIFIALFVLLVGLPFAWAEEGDPPLSPAEIALQQQLAEQKGNRFRAYCEHTLLSGDSPQKTELITKLNGQTCDEAALVIANPPAN